MITSRLGDVNGYDITQPHYNNSWSNFPEIRMISLYVSSALLFPSKGNASQLIVDGMNRSFNSVGKRNAATDPHRAEYGPACLLIRAVWGKLAPNWVFDDPDQPVVSSLSNDPNAAPGTRIEYPLPYTSPTGVDPSPLDLAYVDSLDFWRTYLRATTPTTWRGSGSNPGEEVTFSGCGCGDVELGTHPRALHCHNITVSNAITEGTEMQLGIQEYNTTLSTAINTSATSFTLANGSDYPLVGPYHVIIDNERINVSGRSGNVFTVASGGRGAGSTIAASHAAGAAARFPGQRDAWDAADGGLSDANRRTRYIAAWRWGVDRHHQYLGNTTRFSVAYGGVLGSTGWIEVDAFAEKLGDDYGDEGVGMTTNCRQEWFNSANEEEINYKDCQHRAFAHGQPQAIQGSAMGNNWQNTNQQPWGMGMVEGVEHAVTGVTGTVASVPNGNPTSQVMPSQNPLGSLQYYEIGSNWFNPTITPDVAMVPVGGWNRTGSYSGIEYFYTDTQSAHRRTASFAPRWAPDVTDPPPPPPEITGEYVWMGDQWIPAEIKVWDGTYWVPIYDGQWWDGTEWKEIEYVL